MKGLMAGVLASVVAAGAWAEVRVVDTSFSREGLQPTYGLTLENLTGDPVARIRYRTIFYTPGRSVPWSDEVVSINIPGGLEPGEVRVVDRIMAPPGARRTAGHEVELDAQVIEAFDINGNQIE